jgi:hypothetical protein
VNVAVAPEAETVPGTAVPPALSLKLDVVTVAGSTSSEKVAFSTLRSGTIVAL